MANLDCAATNRHAKPLRPSRLRRIRLLPAIIIALVSFVGATSVLGFVMNISNQGALATFNAQTRDLRILQTALIDAQSSVRAYLVDGSAENLERYLTAGRRLANTSPSVLQLLDERGSDAKGQAKDDAGGTSFATTLTALWARWEAAMRLAADKTPSQARPPHEDAQAEALVSRIRGSIERDLSRRAAAGTEMEARIYDEYVRLLVVVISLGVIALAAMIYAFHSSDREARGRERSIAESRDAHKQIEQLFFMADMLQSAASQDDTNSVLRATAGQLLPGLSGAMYVFNNSRDRLDLATRWGEAATGACAEHFHPDSCWALKRGKANLNGGDPGGLRCGHVGNSQVTLEIPMAARGQLHGLLEIIADGDNAEARLKAIRPIAAAIGDAMSLALSSMALRERLSNQALKDALTGLYNRRFLEETLERLCLDAERRKSPLSTIMIDLDHFKRLNDLHGHAAGDRVLREVSKAVTNCLRSTDIACRYGGEELCVLLPDCSLEMGEKKAELIRAKVAELSVEGLAVTASLGIACLPETSSRTDLLSNADAALYLSKQNGRNRVVAAAPRSPMQRLSVVEGGAAEMSA